MLLTRKAGSPANGASRLSRNAAAFLGRTIDRRTFLKRSGIAVGGAAALSQLPFSMMGRAEAAEAAAGSGKIEYKRTVCTHCSVGCAIDAGVQNGVWMRQEPVFDSPINLGAFCAKGAAARDHVVTEGSHRLKYPMKLAGGKWQRITWDQALKEVGDKLLQIRKENGPDATMWIGSSKHSNEGAYLFRKFVSMFGTNNMDHQARICHSTTVAGVANTWGYGAMTNSYNDEQNSKGVLFFGSNAAEAHPVSMLHTLHARENGAKVYVVDPRFTRTAAKADRYYRIRSGTDVAFLMGMLHHIFKNGWEDKEYINARVYGMEKAREEAMKYTPDVVESITGMKEHEVRDCAEMMAKNRPSTIIWAMGQTQHTNGTAIVRASCILQLAIGNVGVSGGGTNIYRGHDNVQGATDVGPNPDSLPGYYGIPEGSWKYWSEVWGVDFDWIKGRFASPAMMTKPGFTVSRWIDGILEKKENLDQGTNLRAVIFWGHSPNSQTRGKEMVEAMKKLDLLVVVDPVPTATAAMAAMVRQDGVYLLPAATQYEQAGSATASNRSIQWREKVVDPIFEARPDAMIMYQLAEKFGYAKEFVQKIKLAKEKGGMMPDPEDTLREINRGVWTIGYTGQSPERLQAHMRNMHVFDVKTLRAKGGKDAKTGYVLDGDYFGLPWPSYGKPELKHPGTPNLYDPSKHIMDGGGNFRANFGVEREGVSLLAGDGSHSKGAEIKTGYPEFDDKLLKKLGWWDDLTPEEQKMAEGRNWKTDHSGAIIRVAMKHGCHPFGNARARALVWNFPDPIPIHREPLFSPRPDLIDRFPTYDDQKVRWRMPVLFKTVQQANKEAVKQYPLILTSGRLVEYQGGGDYTRSNRWLAELQQEMFVEINPKDANDRGVRNNEYVWLESPTKARIKIKTQVTERVAPGTVFCPFHFSGWWMGRDILDKYPEGAAPWVRGEAVNTATTYGYDIVTMMQETKTTLCQIMKA
jgi:formate dehydrogenase major subunit